METTGPAPIPFNKPFIAGRELYHISQAVLSGHLAGNGIFTRKCQEFLETTYGCGKALMTSSCTGALEMAAILCDLEPGDEVILPSYTFVSTANAFHLRGAKLVFADITPDTLNLDPTGVEERLGPATKAVCVVHYAGVACEMDAFTALCAKRGLRLVEDAAHAIGATYKGKALGSFGALSAFSFHETKNFISGEGGALAVNDPALVERAEIIWEKGTNRSQFFRGITDKYTWVDIGSSFLPSELVTAFLYAQFEQADEITRRRLACWKHYQTGLAPLEKAGDLRLPVIPAYSGHNAHMFYLLLENGDARDALMAFLRQRNIMAVFHYIPLHSSPMGLAMGYRAGMFPVTESCSARILRLPMFYDLKTEEQDRVVGAIREFFGKA
ncbi:MAG: dTDP-4-amino-4,6-dideoxygalactose transaminase [Fibrobacteres bacterium]|nr:dTDP-4-amino-4,6-dideoxygalactose transaminase [Fibrobacterota bacterium]